MEIPAPLLWVQDSQINGVCAMVGKAGSGTGLAAPTTQVCVTYNNVPTNCLGLPVAQTAPGVFTVDGAYAAAVNQDGTTNSASNPAPAGSLVSVWATGLGPITPAQADGTLVGLPLPTRPFCRPQSDRYRLSALLPSGQYIHPVRDHLCGTSSV